MNGLLAGNLNVNVTFDKDSVLWLLSMIFVLLLVSSLALKVVSKI